MTSRSVPAHPPIGAGPLSAADADRLAWVFKALAEPSRLRLLWLVAAAPAGELCVRDLVGPTERSQPVVSHHLRVLQAAGLLEREQRGKWVFYRLTPGVTEVLEHTLPGSAIR